MFVVIKLNIIVPDSDIDANRVFKLINRPCTYLVHIQSEKALPQRWYNVTIVKAVLQRKKIYERVSIIKIYD